ncbi:hypothetical protein FRC01_008552, partial [Tulasnella sp. 417]
MRFFAAIVFVLAFWPTLLDYALSGGNAPTATTAYPTPTFTDACITRKATVQVSPTLVAPGHNSAKHSVYAFLVDSSISIPTAFRATPSLADAGHVAFAPKLAHGPQALWTSHLHRCQLTLAWLMEVVAVFYLDVLAFLGVLQVLLRKRALRPYRLTSQLVVQFKPTRVLVAWVEVPSVEGLLLLYSYITNSPESPDQWRALWIPRRKSTYYLSNGPTNRDMVLVQPNALDSALLSILLPSPVSYHPWAPQLAGMLLTTKADLVTTELAPQRESTAGRKLGPIRRPHFRSAITKFEGSSNQVASHAASQMFSPKRKCVPVDWVEVPSPEGVLILYAYATTPSDGPAKLTSNYFPRQPCTHYLSNRPANPDMNIEQLYIADSALLAMLLQSVSIHDPWAQQLAGIVLDISREVAEETGVIAATNSAVEVNMVPIHPCSSRLGTQDSTPAIDTTTTSVARVGPTSDTGLEAPVALATVEDTSDADALESTRVEATSTLLPTPLEPVSVRSRGNVQPQVLGSTSTTTLPGPTSPSPGTLPPFNYGPIGSPQFPAPHHPHATSVAYQHTPMVHHPYAHGTPVAYPHAPM